MKNRIDNDTKNGMIVFFSIYLIKILIFALNCFLFFKWTHNGNIEVTTTSLIVISLIFNIIYLLAYNRKPILLFISLIIIGVITKNILNTIVFSLIICNGISFILDLIRFIIVNLIFKIISLCSRIK